MTGKSPSKFEVGQILLRHAAGESIRSLSRRYGLGEYFVREVLYSGRPEYDPSKIVRGRTRSLIR